MITWESKICTSKCDGTHPFFGSVLFCISVMRPSFLQVLGLHHLKPIPKCTNGPLYKEDTHSFTLKACIGKSELPCGLCVWLALIQILPVQVLDTQPGVEKINALSQVPCA